MRDAPPPCVQTILQVADEALLGPDLPTWPTLITPLGTVGPNRGRGGGKKQKAARSQCPRTPKTHLLLRQEAQAGAARPGHPHDQGHGAPHRQGQGGRRPGHHLRWGYAGSGTSSRLTAQVTDWPAHAHAAQASIGPSVCPCRLTRATVGQTGCLYSPAVPCAPRRRGLHEHAEEGGD